MEQKKYKDENCEKCTRKDKSHQACIDYYNNYQRYFVGRFRYNHKKNEDDKSDKIVMTDQTIISKSGKAVMKTAYDWTDRMYDDERFSMDLDIVYMTEEQIDKYGKTENALELTKTYTGEGEIKDNTIVYYKKSISVKYNDF